VHVTEFNDALCIVSLRNVVSVRTAFLWVIKQRVVLISYRHFGTNLSVTFLGSKNPEVILDATDRLSRNVGKKVPLLGA